MSLFASEVESWDQDHSGTFDEAELLGACRRMASRVPGIGPCLGSESPDGVWRVDACDADGDNFVSGEELLQHSIAGLDIAVRLDEAAAKFDVLDLDADGLPPHGTELLHRTTQDM
mmetsp:Transcript_4762/g.10217  ORF Transcript_4762/g.10217 Transcript_4762/m.10217 type:complete len:116 (-) Transcript_4762:1377-1724(-)